jgi:hypothetical protein
MPKISHAEMIQTALLTVIYEQSFTRQELWRVIKNKFPEANYKYFLTTFKKFD